MDRKDKIKIRVEIKNYKIRRDTKNDWKINGKIVNGKIENVWNR